MATGTATHLKPRLKPRRRTPGYVELHTHSDHSLLLDFIHLYSTPISGLKL